MVKKPDPQKKPPVPEAPAVAETVLVDDALIEEMEADVGEGEGVEIEFEEPELAEPVAVNEGEESVEPDTASVDEPEPEESIELESIQIDTDADKALISIVQAHDEVEMVLRERTANIVPAFISNVRRDRPGAVDTVLGLLLGAGVLAVTWDPVTALAAATGGLFARNAKRLHGVRGSSDQIGDSKIAELDSFWNKSCYLFIRFVQGFNKRVEVVRALREDEVQLDVAREWEIRLEGARPQLIRARDELVRLTHLTLNKKDREELEDRARMKDPLGCDKGAVTMLSWLDVDAERIRMSLADDQLKKDIVKMRDLRERFDRMQASHGDVESALHGDHAIYEDLDQEYGAGVDEEYGEELDRKYREKVDAVLNGDPEDGEG